METQELKQTNQSLQKHRLDAVEDRIYAKPVIGGNGRFHINGLIVDPQPIADGIYEMICQTGQDALVAFGMIPKEFIDLLERSLREKLIRESARQIECTVEELTPFLCEARIKATIQPIVSAVATGIYKAASQAGRMVV